MRVNQGIKNNRGSACAIDGVEGKPIFGRDEMLKLHVVCGAWVFSVKFQHLIFEDFMDPVAVEFARALVVGDVGADFSFDLTQQTQHGR